MNFVGAVGCASGASAPRGSRSPIAAFVLLVAVGPAWAGAPFLTDDPEPVGYRHWEVYGFSMGSHAQGDSNGTLAGVDANYGVGTNAQLHLIAPLAFDHPGDSGSRTGIGDIELGVKYRFVDPGPNDGWPQVAVYPLLEVPTGDADQGLGNSHVRAFLPVWLQKDLGEWKTYGGGGLWINPGTNNHNYWFFGWLLQRQFTDRLAVGGELFHQTADADDGKDTSGFNVGAIYDLTDHYHVLCSGGRGVQNAAQTNEFSYYVAVQWTFGPHASGRFPGVVQDI